MSKQIKIRFAESKDAPAMLEIYAPSIEDSSVSFETSVPTADEFQHRMQGIQSTYPWLCAVTDNRIAGYAYASEHRSRAAYKWCVEISAYVHPDFRGQRVGTRLYQMLFSILQRQGFCNAYAGITLPNGPSIALHEALGMKLLGVYPRIGFKLGSWHDVGWWHIDLRRREKESPSLPIPITQLELPSEFFSDHNQ